MLIPNLESMIDKIASKGDTHCPKCDIEWMYHYWSHIINEYGAEYIDPVCPDVVDWKRENSEST